MDGKYHTNKYWKIIQLCAILFAALTMIFSVNELSKIIVYYLSNGTPSVLRYFVAIIPATLVVLLCWVYVFRQKKRKKCEISRLYSVYGLPFLILIIVMMLLAFSVFVIVTEIYIIDVIYSWFASEELKAEGWLGVYPFIPLVMYICLTWFFCVWDADFVRSAADASAED